MSSTLDLLLVNPSGRKQIYQALGDELASVEPPLWCRLIAGYVRDRGYGVRSSMPKRMSLASMRWRIRSRHAIPAWSV